MMDIKKNAKAGNMVCRHEAWRSRSRHLHPLLILVPYPTVLIQRLAKSLTVLRIASHLGSHDIACPARLRFGDRHEQPVLA